VLHLGHRLDCTWKSGG